MGRQRRRTARPRPSANRRYTVARTASARHRRGRRRRQSFARAHDGRPGAWRGGATTMDSSGRTVPGIRPFHCRSPCRNARRPLRPACIFRWRSATAAMSTRGAGTISASSDSTIAMTGTDRREYRSCPACGPSRRARWTARGTTPVFAPGGSGHRDRQVRAGRDGSSPARRHGRCCRRHRTASQPQRPARVPARRPAMERSDPVPRLSRWFVPHAMTWPAVRERERMTGAGGDRVDAVRKPYVRRCIYGLQMAEAEVAPAAACPPHA